MEKRPARDTIAGVRDPDRIKRYTLVQRTAANGKPSDGVRRFSLARVGVTPRSALGVDRHERLERIVDAEREDAQDKRS
jgi:hypothetical protein